MTDTPEQDEGGQVRPFAAILQDINNGAVARQAAEELQQLGAAVADQRKKGKLVITVELSPRKGYDNALNVSAKTVLTLPAPEPTEAVLFTDASGNLLSNDPRQPMLPGIVREVPNPNEIKEVRQV